jgi:hypothetical protein
MMCAAGAIRPMFALTCFERQFDCSNGTIGSRTEAQFEGNPNAQRLVFSGTPSERPESHIANGATIVKPDGAI